MTTPTTPGIKNPQKDIRGGFNTATIYSGALLPNLAACPGAVSGNADILLFSGAGRLDWLLPHTHTMASGVQLPIVFYDAGVTSSGGPFASSGHKILGFFPFTVAPVSGAPVTGQAGANSGQVCYPAPTTPITIDCPFQSGLAVALKSGQCGFTVGFTPEIANQ